MSAAERSVRAEAQLRTLVSHTVLTDPDAVQLAQQFDTEAAFLNSPELAEIVRRALDTVAAKEQEIRAEVTPQYGAHFPHPMVQHVLDRVWLNAHDECSCKHCA